jgi:arginine:ornithine antiporter / lysine permease
MSSSESQKLSLPALIALVVGSMVGAGIFSLPSAFGRATGTLGALIAWAIAGVGMLMLAFVFQTLASRKPDLDAGVYAYAKAGFGNYLGFLSALGFWAGSCVGNVSYWVLIKSTLGAFFPVFGDGNTVTAVVISSILLWGFHFLILRGVKEAAGLNTIVTIAKMAPILLFIVVLIIGFKRDVFALNFYGGDGPDSGNIFSQVRQTMLVTVFVFLGIEGASVYSRYAKNRADVGKATVLGFLGVLCLLILVTVLSYGVMLRQDLGALRNPSMAGVLEAVVGPWGSKFISAGLIVSVLGAYLSWTLLAAEVLWSAAMNHTMPVFLAAESEKKVPSTALWLTSGFVQVFLILTLFAQYAFTLALELTSSLSLIPYLLVAGYGLKLAVTRETYERDSASRKKDLVVAAIATFYSILMLIAGGAKYLLLSALVLAPGTFLYLLARREQKVHLFTPREWVVFAVLTLATISAVIALITGKIAI